MWLKPEELDDRDRVIWVNFMTGFFDGLQADYELFQERVFSKKDLEYLVIGELKRMVDELPRTPYSWRKGIRNKYQPVFRSFIDEQLEEAGV